MTREELASRQKYAELCRIMDAWSANSCPLAPPWPVEGESEEDFLARAAACYKARAYVVLGCGGTPKTHPAEDICDETPQP
jgi:hypothetical protein